MGLNTGFDNMLPKVEWAKGLPIGSPYLKGPRTKSTLFTPSEKKVSKGWKKITLRYVIINCMGQVVGRFIKLKG